MTRFAPRFVGPVERLLALRSSGNLSVLSPEEVAHLAGLAEERVFNAGSSLFPGGVPVDRVQLLLEGRVSFVSSDTVYRSIEAPGSAGLLAALAHEPAEVHADTRVVSLELDIEHFVDSMESDFRLFETVFRQLSAQLVDLQRNLESSGRLHREEPADTPYPIQPLDFVDRLEALRRGPYQTASLDAIAELARRAVEVRVEPGEHLWRQGDLAEWGMHVIHGVVACRSEERSFRMGPGSAVGYLEASGGMPRSYDAVGETKVVALRNDTETFMDVLEDNFDLALANLSFLAKTITRTYVQAAHAGLVSTAKLPGANSPAP